ncbi:hypothetical protein F4826_001007 [Rahnella inusitata]|nr:hypothetical protein [Rahnella inusitata]
MKTIICLLILSSPFYINPCFANMSVYPMIVDIDANGSTIVQVSSKSDEPQFVKVDAKIIRNAGTKEEKEESLKQWESKGIIVTPPKFALASGVKRVIRLISIEAPEKETVWRVYFEGVAAPEDLQAPSPKNDFKPKVGVNLIWGVLVHVAPQKPVVSLKIDKASGDVVNTGTQRVPVKEIGVCDTQGSCKWFPENLTVYPDTTRKIKRINLNNSDTYKIRYFDWIDKSNKELALPSK